MAAAEKAMKKCTAKAQYRSSPPALERVRSQKSAGNTLQKPDGRSPADKSSCHVQDAGDQSAPPYGRQGFRFFCQQGRRRTHDLDSVGAVADQRQEFRARFLFVAKAS